MSRVRLVPIVLIVVISLAVLFGFWRLYLQFSLVRPLVADITDVPGVQSAVAVSANPPYIRVTLKPDADYETTYNAIQQSIVDNGTSESHFDIVSSNAPVFSHILEAVSFPLYEDIKHGDYTRIPATIAHEAKAMHAVAKVSMDEHQVYIQISKDHHIFYKMIPYSLQ